MEMCAREKGEGRREKGEGRREKGGVDQVCFTRPAVLDSVNTGDFEGLTRPVSRPAPVLQGHGVVD